jgi:site-specific DNA-methyltransferase (adenine-specific)
MDVKNVDGLEYWRLSREVDRPYPDRSAVYHFAGVGMNSHYNTVKKNEENSVEFVKPRTSGMRIKKKTVCPTIQKKEKIYEIQQFTAKNTALKPTMVCGTASSRWKRWKSLSANTIKLKDGGTMIMFFDLWKITALKELMEKYKFKQVRMII